MKRHWPALLGFLLTMSLGLLVLVVISLSAITYDNKPYHKNYSKYEVCLTYYEDGFDTGRDNSHDVFNYHRIQYDFHRQIWMRGYLDGIQYEYNRRQNSRQEQRITEGETETIKAVPSWDI